MSKPVWHLRVQGGRIEDEVLIHHVFAKHSIPVRLHRLDTLAVPELLDPGGELVGRGAIEIDEILWFAEQCLKRARRAGASP